MCGPWIGLYAGRMAESSGIGAAWRTLNIPNFRNYMAGNFVSQVGLWTQRIGVQWLTWELTHSPTWLGVMAFADFFPIVVMGQLGGVLADRLDPLKAVRLYVLLSAALSASIAALTLGGLITIDILMLLVLLNGMVMGFNYPVRISIIPALVGRDALTSAIGINSVGFSIARVGGPALAGLIISQWGVGPAVGFTAVAGLVFFAGLHRVRLVAGHAAPEERPAGRIPAEIMDGFRYIRNHPGLSRLVVVLVATSVFARPFTDLFAGFADTVFGMGAGGLAWLTSMQGLGAAVGGILLASHHGVAGLTRKMVSCIFLMALAVFGFAATDYFPFALLCTVFAGFSLVALGIIELSLMQASVDDAMRGRVASLYTMIARGCPSIGALLMGTLASHFGFQIPIAGGAVLCLGVWIWARRRQDGMAAALETVADNG